MKIRAKQIRSPTSQLGKIITMFTPWGSYATEDLKKKVKEELFDGDGNIKSEDELGNSYLTRIDSESVGEPTQGLEEPTDKRVMDAADLTGSPENNLVIRGGLGEDRGNFDNLWKWFGELYNKSVTTANASCFDTLGISSNELKNYFSHVKNRPYFSGKDLVWNKVKEIKNSIAGTSKSANLTDSEKVMNLIPAILNFQLYQNAHQNFGSLGYRQMGGTYQVGGIAKQFTSTAAILRSRFEEIVLELENKRLKISEDSKAEIYSFLNSLRRQEENFLNLMSILRRQENSSDDFEEVKTLSMKELLSHPQKDLNQILQRGGKLQRHMVRAFNLIDQIAKEHKLFEYGDLSRA